ncbi:MAG: FadR/GntR family transcriptional regulator [Nocardioidaceae bacterium]
MAELPAESVATGLAGVALRPVRDTNAFEATVGQLATAIRLGVFAEGDRLPPERVLAASLRVSRATLREAIAALRQAGLVTTRSGRGGGTVVARTLPGDAAADEIERRTQAQELVASHLDSYRDVLILRRVIEPGAAAVAASRELTTRQREWLRTALADVSNAPDPLLYQQADSRLHLAVAKLSGSSRLLELATAVRRDLHDLLTAIPVLAVNIAHSNADHCRVVEAILAGDDELARTVMESHCDASAALLRGLLGLEDTPPRRNI